MAEGGFSSALLTKLDKVDCSQILAAVLKADRELLGHIKMGPVAENIEVNWIEDELVSNTFEGTTSHSMSIALTVLSTTASIARIIRAGDIVVAESAEFYFKVIDYTASLLSVSAYGCTTSLWTSGGMTTATMTFRVISKPYADLDNASDDISKLRSKRRNFTQTFERAIQITQSRKGISMEAVVDELQHQIKLRTLEMKRELDMSVIMGRAYWDGSYFTASSETRTMMGILEYLRDYDLDGTIDDTLVTSTSGALTIAGINDLLYKIWDAGGLDEQSDCVIVVGGKQQRVIASFESYLRRVEQGERQVGYYRDTFLSDMGKEFPIVLDRWMPIDKLLVLDRSRVALRALRGDAWHMEKMAKTGRSEKWQISGQYTIEVRNPDKCHGMLRDLT
jgi:hypothetical protein